MKTITVKGKVYEIGKLYETETGCGILTGFIEEDDCFEILNDGRYTLHNPIKVISKSAGTIKDAPIELEIGSWYLVENALGTKVAMYWDGAVFTEGVDTNGNSCGGVAKFGGLKVISKLKA